MTLSSDESTLVKATRNEDLPPKQKYLNEILYCYQNLVDYESMTDIVAERAKGSFKSWMDFGHILVIMLSIEKIDSKHTLLKKYKKETCKFKDIPLGTNSHEKLTKMFSEYFVRLVAMYNSLGIVIEENTTIFELKTTDNWRRLFAITDELFSHFDFFKSVEWQNTELYVSPLCTVIVQLLLREAVTVVFKLVLICNNFIKDINHIQPVHLTKLAETFTNLSKCISYMSSDLKNRVPENQRGLFPEVTLPPTIFEALNKILMSGERFEQTKAAPIVEQTLTQYIDFINTNEAPFDNYITSIENIPVNDQGSRSSSTSTSNSRSGSKSRKGSQSSSTRPHVRQNSLHTPTQGMPRYSYSATPRKQRAGSTDYSLNPTLAPEGTPNEKKRHDSVQQI
ncbi:hypothetical protein EIN_428040 [Entamoeba invadens IP1]|uniref:Uncharacterized protein n=1 Tax=Entamoeba invadens IP1 TaxID=370355 RepID=A0A0A1UF69_ENTIV|nr:hypothetical protein EIN_428040 [Entamoeba invadens IP1]ELP95128.1 hypothetical protein EIN_428040 [Entamoeba invadens IP1]|eukprot:XP_004261899.1 hypothetical protein EIN_428040 [Entamoeba invadens IP1]